MLQGCSPGCPIPGGRMDPSEKARRPRAIAAAPAQAQKKDSLDSVSVLSCTRGTCRGLRTSQPHPMPQAEPCCSPASSGSHPASAAQRGEQEPPCSKQKGKHMDYRHTRKQSPSSVHISTKSSTKHRMLLSNSRFKSTKLRADSCLIHASPKGQHSSTAARRRRLSEIR